LVVLFTLTESLIVHAANGHLREGERRGGEGRGGREEKDEVKN
jgi:hypothetical protein